MKAKFSAGVTIIFLAITAPAVAQVTPLNGDEITNSTAAPPASTSTQDIGGPNIPPITSSNSFIVSGPVDTGQSVRSFDLDACCYSQDVSPKTDDRSKAPQK